MGTKETRAIRKNSPHCSLYNLHAFSFIQRPSARIYPSVPSSGNAIDLNRSRKSCEKTSLESLDNVRSPFLRARGVLLFGLARDLIESETERRS